jgi:hypothetical protein
MLTGDGKVNIPEDLRTAVKKADGPIWIAATGNDGNMFGGGKGGFGGPAPPSPKYMVATARPNGDEANIRVELVYGDADTAKRAASAIEDSVKKVKEFIGGFAKMGGPGNNPIQNQMKLFDTLKVTTDGSSVILTMTGPIDAISSMGKSGGGGFGK